MTDQPLDTPNPDVPARPWEWNHREADLAATKGPIAQFQGNFGARQAADHFASRATSEPLCVHELSGTWESWRYSGRFRLIGDRRIYHLTYDPKQMWWRVYLVVEGEKKKVIR